MRRDIRDGGERGKVKFRVIEFEVEGAGDAVHEGLRNLAAAINRSGTFVALPAPGASSFQHVLPGQVQAGPTRNAETGSAAPMAPTNTRVEDAADPTQDDPQRGDPDIVSRPRSPRKYSTPNIVPDLELEKGRAVTFRQFAEQKQPQNDYEKYLVAAAWLKEHASVEELTTDHFYTCFLFMDWRTQKDFSQPLRALKQQRRLSQGSTRGTYVINSIGLSVVAQMPK